MVKDNIFILRDLDKFFSITEAIKSKGYKYETKVIDCKVIEANYYISKQLEVPLATKLFCLSKIRVVEDEPKTIETIYVDYSKVAGFENEDFSNISFYKLLEAKTGYKTVKYKEELLIVEANKKECEMLHLNRGDEILLIKGTSYIDDGKPFEYFELSCDPTFYRFYGG